MEDILGQALLDYQYGKYTEDLYTETNISERDILPLSYLFRAYTEMPPIEQKALQLTKGKVLDVGCGAGSHALYLQEKGIDVTAIDSSKGAVQVCKLRGLKQAFNSSLLEFHTGKFDTILLLMNGTGIFEDLESIDRYLQHLKSLLNSGGQILVDSSDLQYMYDTTADGAIIVPADRYYGALEFTMSYKNKTTTPFNWLYLDERLFCNAALKSKFDFDIIERGDHFQYLAKLTK